MLSFWCLMLETHVQQAINMAFGLIICSKQVLAIQMIRSLNYLQMFLRVH